MAAYPRGGRVPERQRGYPSLRTDMTSRAGQLSPAAITCTLVLPFMSMRELISSPDGATRSRASS